MLERNANDDRGEWGHTGGHRATERPLPSQPPDDHPLARHLHRDGHRSLGYQLSACGSTTNSASQQVVVNAFGGTAVFYVTPISPCAAGLTPHEFAATYGTQTFTGLFCVNTRGIGTYTQGTVSGFGSVATVGRTTVITAVGKNLALFGSTNDTKNGFVEVAPVRAIGTITLS